MLEKKTTKLGESDFPEVDLKQLKKDLLDDLSRFVAQDLAPFQSVKKKGFLNIANKFIEIGSKFGNVQAEAIISDLTTVSQHTAILADNSRGELKSFLGSLSARGMAITTDVWTDDFKKRPYLGGQHPFHRFWMP